MKKVLYRLTAFLLAAVMLLSFVGCEANDPTTESDNTPAEAETTSEPKVVCEEHNYVKTEEYEVMPLCDGLKRFTCTVCGDFYDESIPATKSIKILALGNSYTKNSVEYLWDMCKSAGMEEIVIGNLYIGSTTLEDHWNNASQNNAVYIYYKNTDGSWKANTKKTISYALADEKWDIVTLQQSSGSSGISTTYSPYLNNLLNFLNENKPAEHTEIIWNMTWSYSNNYTGKSWPNYNHDQMLMYQKIVECTKDIIVTDDRFSGIIPVGTAIENLRTSYLGDSLNHDDDGYHLNDAHGKYIVALTWYAYLTGGSLYSVRWVPEKYDREIQGDIEVIREAVENALNKPFEVTLSETPEISDEQRLQKLGLDASNYKLLDWQPSLGKYYDATKGREIYQLQKCTGMASCLFTKDQLPVGSVIIVDEGYKYRPEAWKVSENVASARQNPVVSPVILVDESWWASYEVRAFNFFYAGISTTMTEADNVHLRIYVPLSN